MMASPNLPFIVDATAHILVVDDEPEIAEAIATYLTEEGVAVHTGVEHKAIREENGEKVVTVVIDGSAREFRADQVLKIGRASCRERV